MSSHTPGPWTIGVERNRASAYNDVEALGRDWPEQKIALVSCDNPNYRANQRLIAAAPALLAASKALLCAVGDAATAAAAMQLRDAIGNAEGRS